MWQIRGSTKYNVQPFYTQNNSLTQVLLFPFYCYQVYWKRLELQRTGNPREKLEAQRVVHDHLYTGTCFNMGNKTTHKSKGEEQKGDGENLFSCYR